MRQALTVENPLHLLQESQPIRQGVPWPQGVLQNDVPLFARLENGDAIPLAARVLNCWPDGSVQWSLLDFSLDLEPSGKARVLIDTEGETHPSPSYPAPPHPVEAYEDEKGAHIGNGKVFLKVRSETGVLVSQWQADGKRVLEDNGFDVVLEDENGVIFSAAACASKKVWVEESSPLRATIRVEGKHQSSDGSTLLDFWLRFTIMSNRNDVKISYHYRNREDAEPGVVVNSMRMRFDTTLKNAEHLIVHTNRTREFRTTPIRIRDDFEIISSHTPDLENYAPVTNGTSGGIGRVFISPPEVLRDDAPKPWFLQSVEDFKFGAVFPPEWSVWSCVGLIGKESSLVMAGANMLGLHPKSLKIEEAQVEYSIWPQWAAPFEITQGEGRTLDFHIGALEPNASDQQILQRYFSWEFGNLYPHYSVRAPIKVSLDPDHVRDCQVFSIDKLPRFEPQKYFAFERKVKNEWTPDEMIPSNGHLHYGDVFYGYGVGGNNEEMAGLVWFQEYLRSGRSECLEKGLAQAQHILDVDIVMHSHDPYQNGGMCAHGPRHNRCAAYPSHMWFTELLFAYALTGDEKFKKGALRVCDNLVFWINDPQGFEAVSNDGRESGQPLINLAWTYQFAPEQKYLDAMWKIARESFMAKVEKHGQLVYMKPREDFTLLRDESYGQWAAWEGLFWMWELTRDEDLKNFILRQLEWRLTEERMATHGNFRATDFNVAAYAFLMTNDVSWLHRVARPFRAAWRASQWQIAWIKAMYFINLALEHGIVSDEEILVS